MAALIEKIWYQNHFLKYVLMPLSVIFWALSLCSCVVNKLKSRGVKFPVPVIVVGNISVGGTGKTPIVLWLVEELRRKGFKPGIVSRGYGGKSDSYPLHVTNDTFASVCGDEPLMLRLRSAAPVVVSPDRVQAVNALLQTYDCDVVVSDDGLQHYRMPRDLEIIVIDGERKLGNGWCLPAGPLRELASRLKSADYILVQNGKAQDIIEPDTYGFSLEPQAWVNLQEQKEISLLQGLQSFGKEPNAVAAIGNPQRFFDLLNSLNIHPATRSFRDHHYYQESDLDFNNKKPVLMTEKDAVKCRHLDRKGLWYLKVNANLSSNLIVKISEKLRAQY